MRVQGNNNVNNYIGKYKTKVQETSKAKDVGAKRDIINISSTAREIQLAFNALKSVPDIREEKVNVIKENIEAGTYNIDSAKIAAKIMNSSL